MVLLDRGYTSHEHYAELGIIHMNGRLYDPLQRRFLNADESINDPNNTQSYNKYGYVMNNPLLYNDPSGEFLFVPLLVAAAIGAAVAVASYAIGSYIANGSWEKVSLSGTLKAAFWGAVSGAATFGIGECFTATVNGAKAVTAFSKTFGGVLVRAAAHGISQGTLAMMQNDGAGFLSGAAGGFFGSLGATAWGGAGGEWKGIGGDFGKSSVGTIAFGALSGGVGAELSGGNFWQGAIAGGIVAGLNDVMHKIQQKQDLDAFAKEKFGADYKTKYGVRSLKWGSEMPRNGIQTDKGIALYNMRSQMITVGSLGEQGGISFNGVTYISDGIQQYGNEFLQMTIGHEFIHDYHNKIFNGNYNHSASEYAAYKYTINFSRSQNWETNEYIRIQSNQINGGRRYNFVPGLLP